MSLSGGKSKSKETFNRVDTNTLSDRAVGQFEGQLGNLRGQTYNAFDPSSIAAYLNPQKQAVIDASLAQADQADAVARSRAKSEMAKAGALGYDRRGLWQAELDAAQSRDRASLIAGLNSDAYDKAQTAAMTENGNRNSYNLNLQSLISQLVAQFGREGTTNSSGSGTSTGTRFGVEWTAKLPSWAGTGG